MHEITTKIAGNMYGVRFDNTGKILETACVGRWTWSSVPTGSAWLDNELQEVVNFFLEVRNQSNEC